VLTGRVGQQWRSCSIVCALAVVLVMPPVLDHDYFAIPVMPAQVPIPVSITHDAIPVSIAHDSDAASADFVAFRDDHRLVGNDRGTGVRRGGQERDGK
jgi:hypothetical protein